MHCGVEIFRFHRAAGKVAHGQVQFDAVGGDGLIVVKLHIAHGGSDGELFKVEGFCIRHGQNKLRFRLAAQIAVSRHFVADGQRFILSVGNVEPLVIHVLAVQGGAGGAGVNDDGQAAVINVQHGILQGDVVTGHVCRVGACCHPQHQRGLRRRYRFPQRFHCRGSRW